MFYGLLSFIVFLPLIGGLIILFIPERFKGEIRYSGVAVSSIVFLLSIILLNNYSYTGDFEFVERFDWFPSLGINYNIGIDGISLLLILLTTLLIPLVIWGSIGSIEKGVKGYVFLFLLLETAMLGAFVSLNLFLFYIFWEAMLIPMYFIIGIWGSDRRIYATIKFFLYTLFGSLLMLVAIIYMGLQMKSQFGFISFEYSDFLRLNLEHNVKALLFLAFFISFAIKVPLFPFHTWLPDAHVEAPTGGSVILAAILLKMGTYGIVRFSIPLFPDIFVQYAPFIGVISLIGIIYGALVAMVQADLKKLVAFSSVSHLGFVVLGLSAMNEPGVSGSVLQMINHGLSTGALFFLVGMIYERRHTKLIKEFGGISRIMPVYAGMFLFVSLSSMGVPGTNGFIGEFLIIMGTIKYKVIFGIISASGVILSAVYLLWAVLRVFHGELKNEKNKILQDLNLREISILSIISIFILWVGIYPDFFLSIIKPSVIKVISILNASMFSGGN